MPHAIALGTGRGTTGPDHILAERHLQAFLTASAKYVFSDVPVAASTIVVPPASESSEK